MAALHRLVVIARLEKDQAEQLARIAREVGCNVYQEKQKTFASAAGDEAKLRGIPAVVAEGGLGGAIRGTRPGGGVTQWPTADTTERVWPRNIQRKERAA